VSVSALAELAPRRLTSQVAGLACKTRDNPFERTARGRRR
jgi:hypothetical protein